MCDHPGVAGILYLVGTPIGNLGDLSDRARETLAAVDVVAAEDTRRTGRLLAGAGISAKKLVSSFEGNEAMRAAELLGVLRAGADVAVVTDAGMPVISDPGSRLVRAAVEAGVEVRVVPGPSSALAALVVAGLPADRFVFEGFLPRRGSERRARLLEMAIERRTIVVFESPRRVARTLGEIAESLGADRRVVVARELTKLHEEVLRGTAGSLAEGLRDADIKGEVVLVIEGASAPSPPSIDDVASEARMLVDAGMRMRAAAAEVAKRRGVPANDVYRALLSGSGESS